MRPACGGGGGLHHRQPATPFLTQKRNAPCALQVEEVVDSIIVSLAKFSGVLHPGAPKSVAAYGESFKARAAVETMFAIASRWGWAVWPE